MTAAHCNRHAAYDPACPGCHVEVMTAPGRYDEMGAPSSAPEAALAEPVVTPGTGEVVAVPAATAESPEAKRALAKHVLVRELFGVVNRFLAEGDSAESTQDACVSVMGLAAHVFNQGTDGGTCELFAEMAHDIYHDYLEKFAAAKRLASAENMQ